MLICKKTGFILFKKGAAPLKRGETENPQE